MTNSRTYSRKNGFTLVELLVVLAVLALLSIIVLASLNGARGKSRDARRIAELSQMSEALQIFYLRNDRYPSENAPDNTSGQAYTDTVNDGTICQGCGGNINDILGQYMGGVPTDPINNSQYYYYYDGRHSCNNPGTDAVLFTFLESGDGNADEVCNVSPPGSEGGGNRTDAYYIVLGESYD